MAFPSVAYAAAKVFFEAAKNTNSRINHKSLVDSLERLRDFQTGVIGPLTLGPDRIIGAAGSYIGGIDLSKKQYAVASVRIVPGRLVQEGPAAGSAFIGVHPPPLRLR